MDDLQQCLTDVLPLLHPRLCSKQLDGLYHQRTHGSVQHCTLRCRQHSAAGIANSTVVELCSCSGQTIVEVHTLEPLSASGGSGKVSKNDAGVLPATR